MISEFKYKNNTHPQYMETEGKQDAHNKQIQTVFVKVFHFTKQDAKCKTNTYTDGEIYTVNNKDESQFSCDAHTSKTKHVHPISHTHTPV